MQMKLAAESHVPCFQERGGTVHPGYMILDRLPWRLRARPSATLHEIQVHSEERTCSDDVTGSGWRRQELCWHAFKGINHEGHEGPLRNSWFHFGNSPDCRGTPLPPGLVESSG